MIIQSWCEHGRHSVVRVHAFGRTCTPRARSGWRRDGGGLVRAGTGRRCAAGTGWSARIRAGGGSRKRTVAWQDAVAPGALERVPGTTGGRWVGEPCGAGEFSGGGSPGARGKPPASSPPARGATPGRPGAARPGSAGSGRAGRARRVRGAGMAPGQDAGRVGAAAFGVRARRSRSEGRSRPGPGGCMAGIRPLEADAGGIQLRGGRGRFRIRRGSGRVAARAAG